MAKNKTSMFSWFDHSGRRSRPFFKEVIVARLLPAIIICSIILGSAWFVTSGQYKQLLERTTTAFIKKTVEMGFVVENLSVKGRKNLSPESVTAILNIQRGDPLLNFNPDKMRRQLESLAWVKSVRIERRFPNTVYVDIVEREPLAFWQNKGKIFLIDDEGTSLTKDNLGKYGDLLLVIGEQAPIHAVDLIRSLAAVPDIAKRVESATWVGNRRWDLILKNKITVRLPEEEMQSALVTLEKLQKSDKLLERAIVLIDLRIKNKLVIRPEAGANTQIERPSFEDKPDTEKDKAI